MNFFEKLLQALIAGGSIAGPIFIHSQHGTAILNASEQTMSAILQAHSESQKPAAPKPEQP